MFEWLESFAENHMFLALLIKIILGAVAFFLALAIIGLICSFLYVIFKRIVEWFNGINRKLDRVCAPAGKTSNPWGMAIVIGLALIFWFAPEVSKRGVSEFWSAEAPLGLPRYQFGAVIIAGLLVLAGLFTAKLRFPLVLGIKIIRIPLDLISLPFRFLFMITGITGSLTGAIKPVKGTVYMNGANYGPVVRRGGPRRTAVSYSENSGSQSNYGGSGESGYPDYSGASSQESGSRDGFAYLGEKYEQPRAADSGGGDGYNYTVTADGSTQYYNGDYRPFSETGATVESYHVDEGYTPMDS